MSETDIPAAGAGPDSVLELPADAPMDFDSPEAAGEFLSQLGSKPKKEQPAESAEEATAETELSAEDNAAPREEAHGEDEVADPEAEKLPPIERPKSWTEAEDAEWQATPRALQQKIVARELDRDTALRRAQNDAAEKLKGLTAKEQAAEQVKAQYEGRLQEQMQALLDVNNQQFGQIKSQADIDFLSSEAIRLANAGDAIQSNQIQSYLTAWQLHQSKMAGKKAELDQAEQARSQKQFSEWNSHVAKENTVIKELIPELADPKANKAFYERAVERMKELDFSDAEIGDLATGKKMLSIHDHRLQRLIWNDLKLSSIQTAKVTAVPKNVPNVQRPGTARPAGTAHAERIQALTRQLEQTGDMDVATELYELQSRQRRA